MACRHDSVTDSVDKESHGFHGNFYDGKRSSVLVVAYTAAVCVLESFSHVMNVAMTTGATLGHHQ